MTRQWLMAPHLMCRQHLLGEHAEAHMFVSKMEKGWSLDGFYRGSMFFGAEFVKRRHDILAPYLTGHKTPLSITDEMRADYPILGPERQDFNISISTLLTRCERCRNLYVKG